MTCDHNERIIVIKAEGVILNILKLKYYSIMFSIGKIEKRREKVLLFP